jgi:hypothetical protein
MQTEILDQGPGWTIARKKTPETLVPYGPAQRPSGAVNHGWIDLRDHPERVAFVPEAARSEGLSKLLGVIADPVSKVMSIGCECAAFQNPKEDNPRWQVGGYVAVAFKDADLNCDPQKLVNVAHFILSGIGPSSEYHIGFEFIVEPLKFFFGRTGCHALVIKPLGRGNDEPQAWASFEYAAAAIATAIEKGREAAPSPRSAPDR